MRHSETPKHLTSSVGSPSSATTSSPAAATSSSIDLCGLLTSSRLLGASHGTKARP